MCQVEWFHEALPFLTESAGKVLSVLINLSNRQGVTPQGRPVLTPAVPLQVLAKRTRLSRRGVQTGLSSLEEMGLITTHRSLDPRGATTYSISIMRPPALERLKKQGVHLKHPPPKQMRGANFAPPLTTHDDVDDDQSMPIVQHHHQGEVEEGMGETEGGALDSKGAKNAPRAEQVWKSVLEKLQGEISPANFGTWLKDTEGVNYDGKQFFVAVRNAFARDWLEKRLHSLVLRVLIEVLGRKVEVKFQVGASAPQPVDEEAALVAELENVGLDNARAFVGAHSPEVLRAALERAQNSPGIENIPGFVRYLVEVKLKS